MMTMKESNSISDSPDKSDTVENNASGASKEELQVCSLSRSCSLLNCFNDDFEEFKYRSNQPLIKLEVDKEKLIEISEIRSLVDSLLNPDMND